MDPFMFEQTDLAVVEFCLVDDNRINEDLLDTTRICLNLSAKYKAVTYKKQV